MLQGGVIVPVQAKKGLNNKDARLNYCDSYHDFFRAHKAKKL